MGALPKEERKRDWKEEEIRADARPPLRGWPSFHDSWERAENDADGRKSFATV